VLLTGKGHPSLNPHFPGCGVDLKLGSDEVTEPHVPHHFWDRITLCFVVDWGYLVEGTISFDKTDFR